ncbi:hypothetical protein F0U63_00840 [Cystobacter fuscus]|nr:hypothetical protein F0U63_00840 [Cystobacter fuscus]
MTNREFIPKELAAGVWLKLSGRVVLPRHQDSGRPRAPGGTNIVTHPRESRACHPIVSLWMKQPVRKMGPRGCLPRRGTTPPPSGTSQ